MEANEEAGLGFDLVNQVRQLHGRKIKDAIEGNKHV